MHVRPTFVGAISAKGIKRTLSGNVTRGGTTRNKCLLDGLEQAVRIMMCWSNGLLRRHFDDLDRSQLYHDATTCHLVPLLHPARTVLQTRTESWLYGLARTRRRRRGRYDYKAVLLSLQLALLFFPFFLHLPAAIIPSPCGCAMWFLIAATLMFCCGPSWHALLMC